MADIALRLDTSRPALIVERADSRSGPGWSTVIDPAVIEELVQTFGVGRVPDFQPFSSVDGISTLLRDDDLCPESRRGRPWLIIKGAHDFNWEGEGRCALYLDWDTGRPTAIEEPMVIGGFSMTAAEVVGAELAGHERVTFFVGGLEHEQHPRSFLSTPVFASPHTDLWPESPPFFAELRFTDIEPSRPNAERVHDLSTACKACGAQHRHHVDRELHHAFWTEWAFVDAAFSEGGLELLFWVREKRGDYSSRHDRWFFDGEPRYDDVAFEVSIELEPTTRLSDWTVDGYDGWSLYGFDPSKVHISR